jgi:hypothetical protein
MNSQKTGEKEAEFNEDSAKQKPGSNSIPECIELLQRHSDAEGEVTGLRDIRVRTYPWLEEGESNAYNE